MSSKAERGQMGYYVLPELVEGKELNLSLVTNTYPGPGSTVTERTALTCTIVKAFRPFTISPVLLVSLARPPTPPPPGYSQRPFPSTAVLKLYDRRCLSNIRDDWDERRPWSPDKERSYRRYLDDVASGAVDVTTAAAAARAGDLDDEAFLFDHDDVSDGEFEAHLQRQAQGLFGRERTAYERLRCLQGTKIPRVYAAVEHEIAVMVPDACPGPDGSISPAGSAVTTEVVPGLLLEYVPSATLREAIETWRAREPPLPNGILAALCEKAVEVVERISDFGVLNEDVHMDNFLVRQPFITTSTSSHQGEGGDLLDLSVVVEDAVVLVDLGHCRMRGEDESEEEWIRAKWSQDEAGAAGFVALGLVRKFVGDDVWEYERSLRYYYPGLLSKD